MSISDDEALAIGRRHKLSLADIAALKQMAETSDDAERIAATYAAPADAAVGKQRAADLLAEHVRGDPRARRVFGVVGENTLADPKAEGHEQLKEKLRARGLDKET